jgi:CHAD domain-containing protein
VEQKQLKHIIYFFYKKLEKLSKHIIAGFDAGTIHEFRLVYKKLRAFLQMIGKEGNKPDERINISGKLKKSYRLLGTTRDLQLQQERILEVAGGNIHKTNAYIALLQQEIDKLKPALVEIFSGDPVAASKKKIKASMPDEVPVKDFQEFLKKQWLSICTIVAAKRFSDDNLHTIRKNLRLLLYNLKISKEADHAILSPGIWKGEDEHYFHKLSDELGKFHDKCIAIHLLKVGELSSLNTFNAGLLGRIKKKWLIERANMKQALKIKLMTTFV